MPSRFLVVLGVVATTGIAVTPAASPKAADKDAKGEKESCERALEKPHPPQSQRKKQPGPCGSSGGQARADFNGDGFADLAVGVPNESVGAVESAGAVQVIYGSTTGLTTIGNQLWTQESPDIADDAESVDRFGEALAAGDFDGDGFADLAVGAPGEDLGPSVDAGAVNVIYGSAAGLTAFGDQLWHQGSDGVEDQIEPFDQFGAALLWANFGKGSQADLAIGVPGEDLGPSVDAGAVNVLYGAAGGLNSNDDQFLSQDSSAILDAAELADFFGQSLAGGDFNADGFADLVVGVPREAIGSTHDAGAVHVIYGSQIGLSPVSIPGLPSTGHNNQFFSQETDGVPEFAEEKDRFGTTLAAGDFDGDLADDLALGTPGEDLGAATNAGAVSVLYGSTGATSGGLSATGSQTHQQGAGGVLDAVEALDNFGFALAAGNFDGDAFDDLAVGVPSESLGTISSAGAVNALYGSSSRLGGGQHQFFNQDTPGVEGGSEPGDFFGAALTAWNFGKGDPSDLAIGVPQEAIGTIQSAGAVNVLYGRPRTRAPGSLIVEGNQVWHQDVPEILEAAEFSDRFGQALY